MPDPVLGSIAPDVDFLQVRKTRELYRGVKAHYAVSLTVSGRSVTRLDGAEHRQTPGQEGAAALVPAAVSARRDFRYDAHGRLVEATGRVHQALLPHDLDERSESQGCLGYCRAGRHIRFGVSFILLSAAGQDQCARRISREAERAFAAGEISEDEYYRSQNGAVARGLATIAATALLGGPAGKVLGRFAASGFWARTAANVGVGAATGAVASVSGQAAEDLGQWRLSSANTYGVAAAQGAEGGAVAGAAFGLASSLWSGAATRFQALKANRTAGGGNAGAVALGQVDTVAGGEFLDDVIRTTEQPLAAAQGPSAYEMAHNGVRHSGFLAEARTWSATQVDRAARRLASTHRLPVKKLLSEIDRMAVWFGLRLRSAAAGDLVR